MADSNNSDGSIIVDTEIDTEGFESGSDRLKSAIESLLRQVSSTGESLRSHISEGFSGAADAVQSRLSGLQERLSSISVPSASSILGFFSNMARGTLSAAGNLAKIAGSGAVRFLGRLATSAKNAGIQLMKMVGNAAITGIRRIGSLALSSAKALLGLGESAKKSSTGLNGGLKSILELSLGIASMQALISKIRTILPEAFGNMAKEVPSVNESISSLMSALSQLKNSLATAFQPILTVVAPYLTQFINMLSSVLTKVGEFFAALTGQKYVYKAAAVQTDYAKSLDKTSSSASKAAKSTKQAGEEAKRQLASFDKLNVLSDSSSSSSDGDSGSGAGADVTQSMFEKVPVSVSDFIQRIKDAFKNGNFTEIGHILGEKINEIFAKLKDLISWDNVGDTITKWVNAICDVINGLVDAIDWELIGSTFAEGINTIVNTLYLLVTGINWENIGTSIGTALTSMVNNINWDTLGALLAYWLTAKLRMLTSAILAFDWVGLGANLAVGLNSFISVLYDVISGIDWIGCVEKIAAGLNRLVSDIDWTGLGDLIGFWIGNVITILTTAITEIDWATLVEGVSTGFNSIVDQITGAVEGIDWVALGESIVNGLNGLISDPNWEEFGTLLGESFNGVLSALLTILTEFDWAGLGETLANWVMSVIETIDWGALGETISTGITGLLTSANEFIQGLDPETIVTAIETFLGGVDWAGIASNLFELLGSALGTLGAVIGGLIRDAFTGIEEYFNEQIEAAGGNVVAGIFNGIINALAGIVTWIDENIFTPFINGILEAFGFEGGSGSSSILTDFGTSIVTSISEGISGLWEAIKGFFSDAWTNITSFFTEADVGGWFTENVWNKIQDVFASVGDWFKTTAENMWGGVTGFFTNLGDGVTTFFTENVWDKITGAFSGVTDWFKTTAENMWNGITGFFSDLGETGIGQWFTENVWNKITGVFSGVADFFKDVAGNIWDGLTGGLSDTVEDVKEKVTGFFSNVWGGVLNFFGIHSPSDTAAAAAGNLMEGFSKGAEDNQASAGERLKAVFSSIYDKAKGVWDSVTGWFKKLFGGGSKEDDQTAKQAGEVASGIDKAFQGVEDSVAQPIEKGVERGQNAFSGLATAAESAVTTIKSAFTASTSGLGDVLTKGFETTDKNIASSMESISKNVTDKLTSASTNADTKLTEMNTKATTTLTTLDTSFSEKFQSMQTNVTTKLTSIKDSMTSLMTTATQTVTTKLNEMHSNATTKLNSLKETTTSGISEIKGRVTSDVSASQSAVASGFGQINSSITSNLSNAMNSVRNMGWNNIGSYIVQGIGNGINNGWSWLQNTVWNLAQSLYRTAKNALGIHSPSRLFRDGVGKMLGLGVAEGMEDSEPKILKSVSSVANAMAAEMNKADVSAELGADGDGLVRGLDDVLSVFSEKVSDSFTSLIDKLEAIASSVAFRTPAVADGSVVPYSVSGDQQGGSKALTDALEASNDEQISAMIQMFNNQTSALVQAIKDYCGVDVRIGDKVIGDAAINEINRRTRATGESPILV